MFLRKDWRGVLGARGSKFGRKECRNLVVNLSLNLGVVLDLGKFGCKFGPGKSETRMTMLSQAPLACHTHQRRPTPLHHTPAHPKLQAVAIHWNCVAWRSDDLAPMAPSHGRVTGPKQGPTGCKHVASVEIFILYVLLLNDIHRLINCVNEFLIAFFGQ